MSTTPQSVLTRPSVRFLFGLLFCVCLIGCGGPDGPPFGLVSGKVMIGDAPVVGASVTLIPDSSAGTTGPQSSGVTNEQGEFTVFGPSAREGAVVGKHKVTINCPFDITGGSSGGGDPTMDTSGNDGCKVASKYFDQETSGLTLTVSAEGSEDVVFNLDAE